MMKFFRKYNKMLLAVFMVLLMVVFVGGSALTSMFTPTNNETIAESRFGPIKRFDQQQAKASTDLLSYMGINWEWLGGPVKPLQVIDWLLLAREASELDANADAAAIESWIVASVGRDQMDLLTRRLKVKTEHIRAAVGELLSIQMIRQAIAGASVPSEAEVRSYARRMLDNVSVDVVMLPGKAFVEPEETFSRERMESHWSPLRDVEPGEGLNFGYYVPHRLAVQFMKIDPTRIAEDIGIANLESKAKRLYDRQRTSNSAFFRPPDDTDDGQVGDIAVEDVEGPVQEKSPYLDWEEAKEAAIALVKEAQSRETAMNLAQWLKEYDAERWIDADQGDSGYRETPDEVRQDGYYQDMFGHVPATFAFPNAVSVKRTAFFAMTEADDLVEIGKAFHGAPGAFPVKFGSLAFRSAPIIPEIPDESGADRSEFLALYQTCSHVLMDAEQNLYVFRVVDVRPSHPSESVDEVEDRVVEDLRLLAGVDRAKAVAEGLRSCSPDTPLHEAFDSDESLADLQADGVGVGFYEVKEINRIGMAEVGSSTPRTVKFVSFGVGSIPNDVVGRWFELEDAWERSEMFELRDRATVLVAEWRSSGPARHEDFEERRDQIVQRLTVQRLREAAADWFDPDKIRARSEFELTR